MNCNPSGQFWNIQLTAKRFPRELFENLPEDIREYYSIENLWVISVDPQESNPRYFVAEEYSRAWDNSKQLCLYAGDSQGGPAAEYGEEYRDSVIEGDYTQYQTSDRFTTEFTYSQFDVQCLP